MMGVALNHVLPPPPCLESPRTLHMGGWDDAMAGGLSPISAGLSSSDGRAGGGEGALDSATPTTASGGQASAAAAAAPSLRPALVLAVDEAETEDATNVDEDEDNAFVTSELARIEDLLRVDRRLEAAVAAQSLGRRLTELERYGEAERNLKQALDIRLAELGEESAATAETLVSLGEVCEASGRFAEAVGHYNAALATRQLILGPEAEATVDCALKVAAIQAVQHEFHRRALEMYEQSLTLKTELLGASHPDVATTVASMGAVYRAVGDYARALDCFGRALAIRIKSDGEQHLQTATTVNDMADIYRLEGDMNKALQYLEWAYNIREQLGATRAAADTLYNLALVYKRLKNFSASLDSFAKAADMMAAIHGEEHPETKDARTQVRRTKRLLEKQQGLR